MISAVCILILTLAAAGDVTEARDNTKSLVIPPILVRARVTGIEPTEDTVCIEFEVEHVYSGSNQLDARYLFNMPAQPLEEAKRTYQRVREMCTQAGI